MRRGKWEPRSSRSKEIADTLRADLDDEIGYHFDEVVKDLLEQGFSREEAEKEAKRRFGDLVRYRRELERINRNRVTEAVTLGLATALGVWNDLRQGSRALMQQRLFTIAALVSLALGIGANTAIFSFINSLLIRPLGVAEAEDLVTVYTSQTGGQVYGNTSYPDYLDYRDQNQVFSGLVAQSYAPMALSGRDHSSVVWGQVVSWDYFSVLGVEPVLGRAFLPEEDQAFGANAVTVLSHGMWRDRFGSDRDIVGSTVRINDFPFTVIGVAPEGFTGLASVLKAELWTPLAMFEQALPYSPNIESRIDPWLQLVGRVEPGLTMSDVQAALDVLAANLTRTYPETNTGKDIVVETLDSGRLGTPDATGGTRRLLSILLGVVGFVLLVACFNVANLQLAKASGQRREIALRFSLGASRWRIVRLLLIESVLLSVLAGALGLVLGTFAVDALMALQPESEVPIGMLVGLDWRVLGFTVLLVLLTGLLFGLAPALQVLRGDQSEALKTQGYNSSQGHGKARVQSALVISQVAISLALLTGAGLFLRSLQNTLSIDPGFDLRSGVIIPVNFGFTQYDRAEGTEIRRRLLDGVGALPGVESVALSAYLPLGLAHGHHDVRVDGYEPATDEFMVVKRNMVSAGYFETMGIGVLSGRTIDERDGEDARPVAMVNQTMARRFWPGEDPIGRTVQADLGTVYTVVGVFEDGKYGDLQEEHESYLAIPLNQGEYPQRVNLVVRTSGSPSNAVGPLLNEVRRLAPGVPQSTVLTVSQYLEYSSGGAATPALLMGAFSILALVLAMVGLYGVMSYTVSQRTREFGVRMALGATRSGIARAVLVRGLATTTIGIVFGILLSVAGTRILAGFLYNVSTLDPLVFGLVALLLFAVGQVASYLPARIAARTNPINILKVG